MGETDTTGHDLRGSGQVEPRKLRVSDAEREHIVALLHKAVGRGLLDLNQFSERADIAYSATTRGELTLALADLPGLVHPDAPRPSGGPAPGALSSDNSLELSAQYSNLVRRGPWVVPERLVVRSRYGTTRLDFTEALISTPVVYLELDSRWGSVDLTIPEHGTVDLTGVRDVKHGSVNDRTSSFGRPGNPKIVVSGRVHGGTLTARHPRRRHWGCC